MYTYTSQLNIVTATPSLGIHAIYRWDGVDYIQKGHSLL